MTHDTKCVALAFAFTILPAVGQPQTTQAIPSGVTVPSTADIQTRDIEQLSPEQRSEFERLSPEQKEAVTKAAARLTPQQREELLKRASEELKRPGSSPKFHIVEGPGIPSGRVVPATHLIGNTDIELNGSDKELFGAAQKILPNIVAIRRRTINQFSDQGVGNGVLISRTLVLTARHVAEQVGAAPQDYLLVQIATNGKQFMTPLIFVKTRSIIGEASDDPDLAFIQVSGSINPARVSFRDQVPKLNDPIASLGSSEMQVLPAMGTGIVTTAPRARELGGTTPLRRTAFGSSVRSFPGLSGAPVFNTNGEIIAVVLGGVKKYAGTGETVTRVPEGTNWDQFPDWTWATPLAPFLAEVRQPLREDQ